MLAGIQPLHAQQEQKTKRTLVDPAAFLILIGKGLQLHVLIQRFIQLHTNTAAHGAEHPRGVVGQERGHSFASGNAGGKIPRPSVNGDVDHRALLLFS